MSDVKIEITKLAGINTIVIKRTDGLGFFISTPDSMIISVSNFATLLNHLVLNNFINHQILEGILEEYHSNANERSVYYET